jgi:hypothetical protein
MMSIICDFFSIFFCRNPFKNENNTQKLLKQYDRFLYINDDIPIIDDDIECPYLNIKQAFFKLDDVLILPGMHNGENEMAIKDVCLTICKEQNTPCELWALITVKILCDIISYDKIKVKKLNITPLRKYCQSYIGKKRNIHFSNVIYAITVSIMLMVPATHGLWNNVIENPLINKYINIGIAFLNAILPTLHATNTAKHFGYFILSTSGLYGSEIHQLLVQPTLMSILASSTVISTFSRTLLGIVIGINAIAGLISCNSVLQENNWVLCLISAAIGIVIQFVSSILFLLTSFMGDEKFSNFGGYLQMLDNSDLFDNIKGYCGTSSRTVDAKIAGEKIKYGENVNNNKHLVLGKINNIASANNKKEYGNADANIIEFNYYLKNNAI